MTTSQGKNAEVKLLESIRPQPAPAPRMDAQRVIVQEAKRVRRMGRPAR
jgi:hypothetical protein